MNKSEVRALARSHGLALPTNLIHRRFVLFPVATTRSSSMRYLAEQGQPIPETEGERLRPAERSSAGMRAFTTSRSDSARGWGSRPVAPLYVIQINGEKRQVIVGGDESLYSRTLTANKLNWVAIPKLESPQRAEVKIRNRHQPAAAMLQPVSEDEVLVTFDEPQRAITPGQAAVFYEGDVVVGGGWIR